MGSKSKTIVLYTLLHFLVDFSTVFLLTGLMLGPKTAIAERANAIILYNLVAFAGQLPIGIVADSVSNKRFIAALGCLLSAISYPLMFLMPWLACICCAIGNGAFHIGAGTEILDMTMPRAGFSGLFVSSGALGVWLAYLNWNSYIIFICPVIMLVSSIYLFITKTTQIPKLLPEEMHYRYSSKNVLLAGFCFLITIVLRSFLGMIMNFPWKSEMLFSFGSVIAVIAGKAAGGFIGDKCGYIKTVAVSLLVSALTFAFSVRFPLAGIIAIFCFNMTMPLTLTAIAKLSQKKYGMAFGLTTFALAIGFIPVVFGASKLFGTAIFSVGSLISLVFIVLGYILSGVKA